MRIKHIGHLVIVAHLYTKRQLRQKGNRIFMGSQSADIDLNLHIIRCRIFDSDFLEQRIAGHHIFEFRK